MDNWEHYTPTAIMRRLVAETIEQCGPLTQTRARKLVKQALASDAVRAVILEHIEETLVDEAAETITDTKV